MSTVMVKGIPVTLSESHKQLVLKLSDMLNLNELSCVNLVFSASKPNVSLSFRSLTHEYLDRKVWNQGIPSISQAFL